MLGGCGPYEGMVPMIGGIPEGHNRRPLSSKNGSGKVTWYWSSG